MTKLLIVDDNEANLYMLQVLLEGNGFKVESAANGRAALELARNEPPELVVTDILMPVMDGFSLCRSWKSDPVLKHVPFIFYTATYTEPKDEEFALSLGAERFVLKPTEPEKLLQIIQEVMAEKERGTLELRSTEIEAEDHFLQEYNVTLINKLEKTIEKLRAANQALTTEVEERKKAEEELRMWGTVFEHADWGIVIFSPPSFVIEQMNPAFAKMHGYDLEELQGASVMKLFSGETREDFPRILRLAEAREHHTFESMNLKKDLSAFPALVNAAAIRDQTGRVKRWVINLLDTSQQKEALEQQARLEAQLVKAQKMEAIGAMTSGIAHDFNNILGAIFGFTELAMLNARQGMAIGENLKMIMDAGNRAKALVAQILSYSRMTKQEHRPIKLGSIVEEVGSFIAATGSPQIEIRTHISDDELINADPTQIHQVLMNLCTNACQAMGEANGVLTIGLKQATEQIEGGTQPARVLKISVADTGPGIPSDSLENIFKPFYTTKTDSGGSGLGLAISKGIIMEHGGAITVESRVGAGTTFNILLPLLGLMQKERDKKERKEPIPSGNERILFVDDEPMLVDFGKVLLGKLGYQVKGTVSSLEALDIFAAQPQDFDLAILDFNMPRINGMELARRIHEIRPDLPIMLCSGFSEPVPEDVARELGISRYIAKPMLAHELSCAIRELLD